MIDIKKMKDNDTFYYILPRFFEEKGIKHLEFNVFAYKFDKRWHHCFDEKLMFLTKEEADKVCKIMNENSGY